MILYVNNNSNNDDNENNLYEIIEINTLFVALVEFFHNHFTELWRTEICIKNLRFVKNCLS